MASNPLNGVEAFVFDVYGTVVDIHGTIVRELYKTIEKHGLSSGEIEAFTKEWTKKDIQHRQYLDEMLSSKQWLSLGKALTDEDRKGLCATWGRLEAWPDSSDGLQMLKKKTIIATLSNGDTNELLHIAKNADLPWDMIFGGDVLGSQKPDPIMYQRTAELLALPTEKVVLVAAHIYDLRAAAEQGMKIVYVPRPHADEGIRDKVRSKQDGGEVDLVCSSFVELAKWVEANL